LLEVKMRAGEAATSARWIGIHDFIESELEAAAQHVMVDTARPDAAAVDAFLAETVLNNERERHESD
jgi:uncharacterized protein